MQALLDDNNSLYVTDDTPNAETRLRARFYFDPNSVTMASGNSFCLLIGFSGTSNPIICLEFRRQGSYQVRLSAVNDLHLGVSTPWVTLSDAPHFIELDWRAAFPQGANNGSIALWLDGAQQANITGIDNDFLLIDRVQLGALYGVDTGTRGAVFFDAYESRRQTYIGPETGGGATPTATSPSASRARRMPPISAPRPAESMNGTSERSISTRGWVDSSPRASRNWPTVYASSSPTG